MGTWRAYFRGSSCPKQYLAGEKDCEQTCIEVRYDLARAKDSPHPVVRLRMGQRSSNCLLLPVKPPQLNQQPKKRTALSAKIQQVIWNKAKKNEDVSVNIPEVSQKRTDIKKLTGKDISARYVDDEKIAVVECSLPPQQKIPSAVQGVDKNDQNIEEKFESKSTEDTLTSVRIRKKRNWDDCPSWVAEVADSLIQDVKIAQSTPGPDTLVKEDVHVAKSTKHVRVISKRDSILRFALDHSIALHGVVSR